MPLYTCITQEGAPSAEQRAALAMEITRIYSGWSGDPASFIRVIFETVSPDSTFIGGKPVANAVIVGLIRTGRSTEARAQLLNDLWSMYKNVTGLSDDQLWVSVLEFPASDGMEYGAILASTRPRSRMAGFARPDQARSVSLLHFCGEGESVKRAVFPRDARAPAQGPVSIKLFGVPDPFAGFLGLRAG